eukprot:gene23711-9253_t
MPTDRWMWTCAVAIERADRVAKIYGQRVPTKDMTSVRGRRGTSIFQLARLASANGPLPTWDPTWDPGSARPSKGLRAADSFTHQIRPVQSPRPSVLSRGYASGGARRIDDVTEMVMSMKRNAQEEMGSTLSMLKERTVASPGGDTELAGSRAIKAKLENAVMQMQDGLVERDTEVSSRANAGWPAVETHPVSIGPQEPQRVKLGDLE